jgi:hypothetical protein
MLQGIAAVGATVPRVGAGKERLPSGLIDQQLI